MITAGKPFGEIPYQKTIENGFFTAGFRLKLPNGYVRADAKIPLTPPCSVSRHR